MSEVQIAIIDQEDTQITLAVPGVQGPVGNAIPSGGTTNQVLFKSSATNYDATWGNVTSAMITDLAIVDADVNAMKKFNKGGISTELTTRYRYIITSVDGKSDTKSITDFINNKFLARDTRAFREYIKKISPDVNMEFEYQNQVSGEMEVRSIPMGVSFFWPSN